MTDPEPETAYDSLAVFWHHDHVGDLSIDRSGHMHFAYLSGWIADPAKPALYHALPKQAQLFGDTVCKAVFGGLLPEEEQRTAVARALGVSSGNPFRLLEKLGGDVAGALSFLPPGEQPARPAQRLSDASRTHEPLDDAALAALMDRLPIAPMLAGQGGARLSLAGAQSKLPVVLVEDRIALPLPGEPSTHLIKPEPARLSGLVANEAFCLELAGAAGLDTAVAHARIADGRAFLLVERYDRQVQAGDRGGVVQRLHQEDFAQALGVLPSHKYAADGGPSFSAIFPLVRAVATRPAREILKLVDAVLFNIIIGNADAHAKNFSFLYRDVAGRSEAVLAPLYDLVATFRWAGLSDNFAMRFGGARNLEQITPGSITRFADHAGIAAPFVTRRGLALAQIVIDKLDDVGTPDDAALRTAIRKRARTLRRLLS